MNYGKTPTKKLFKLTYDFHTVRNDTDTSFEDKFVTFRRRVLWLIVQKDIKVNNLSKLLLAKAVAAQDETFPLDSQFGIFSLEGKLML